MSQLLWVCGQAFDGGGEVAGRHFWDLQGVFDTEEKAIDACHSYNFFVGPVELNQELPRDTVTWEGCYYPYPELL